MRNLCLALAALLAGATLLVSPAQAAKKKNKPATETTPLTAEQAETNYTQSIEKRTGDILAVLDLKDEVKSRRVHDAIVERYRVLRDRQAANPASPKDVPGQKAAAASDQTGQPIAASKASHAKFVATLSADLTPEQLEKVKDKMTYNKVKVTYDAYCEIVPHLTEKDKAKILALLKEAREEAMDGGSSGEKSAIFKRYKGKINIYLSAEGYDVAKAYKDWGAKLKEKTAAKPAQAATEPPK